MLGLTQLGVFHTAISLIAVVAGFIALFRYKEISPRSPAGKIYVAGTVISCLTGFGIFQHGGFGNPGHAGPVKISLGQIGLPTPDRSLGRI